MHTQAPIRKHHRSRYWTIPVPKQSLLQGLDTMERISWWQHRHSRRHKCLTSRSSRSQSLQHRQHSGSVRERDRARERPSIASRTQGYPTTGANSTPVTGGRLCDAFTCKQHKHTVTLSSTGVSRNLRTQSCAQSQTHSAQQSCAQSYYGHARTLQKPHPTSAPPL